MTAIAEWAWCSALARRPGAALGGRRAGSPARRSAARPFRRGSSTPCGQRPAVEWFARWLDAHAERREAPPDIEIGGYEVDREPAHAYAALFAGGRRAGKTWIAVGLAGGAYAIRFPGAIVWLVSPSEPKHDELRRYVHGLLPAEWLDRETTDGWELCNGSRILLKSAHNAEGLKEARQLSNGGDVSAYYTIARGAIVDCSGLVMVCANPPVEAKDQQWVADCRGGVERQA
ncbi:MAG: hypothetical protein WKG01_42160 [Kofleriaceae bacterium]